jgi:hypothetical protein
MNGFKDRIVKDSFIAKYDLEEEKKTIIQRIYDYECYIKGLEQCINYNNTMSDFVIRAKISLDNKKQILYKISEEHHRMRGSYRCPAEMTHGGQDMSYWDKYRENLFNDYKQKALNEIRVEWIRLLKNCKTILTDHDYDMFEEFKKVYPNVANYFNMKASDITWDIAGEYGNNMKNFIDCVIKCLLSQEALNKRNEKIRKQKEIRTISIEERRTLLYKKEYECIKILNELDKNKLKSPELYVEYKKITKLKDGVESVFGKHPDLDNNPFIDYFTEYRKKYINGLIELVNNPTPVTNEVKSTVTSGGADADALFNLGHKYQYGLDEGIAQDYTAAIRLYRLAAAQGHADAQCHLGIMFFFGDGVGQDYVEAMRWFQLAAAQGYLAAQTSLGLMFLNGRGVAKDESQALHFYRLAAAQGDAKAQDKLDNLLRQTQGLAQDSLKDARFSNQPVKNTQKIFQPSQVEDTTENNIVMTVVEIKENNTNTAQVCNKPIQKTQKTQKKGLRKEKDIIRVLNIFTNQNIKKKYFDSGLHKVVLNTPLYEPINEYSKNVNGFWENHTLGVYLNSLYNKELSEFCLNDKKYYDFMCKSTLIPL